MGRIPPPTRLADDGAREGERIWARDGDSDGRAAEGDGRRPGGDRGAPPTPTLDGDCAGDPIAPFTSALWRFLGSPKRQYAVKMR